MTLRGELQPGTLLANRYRIERHLGTGGSGAVHEATDTHLGRRVGLKVLIAPDASAKDFERFFQEAELSARVDHAHVVKLFDFFGGSTSEPAFLVMELVRGVSLSRRLSAVTLPLKDSLIIGEQILSALAAAHAVGVVHRDLKPANIIVRDGNPLHIVLLDFGIATLGGGGARVATTTGTVMGTPGFMPPEQIRGGEVDARSDVYAAGICLFRLLTGRLPFPPAEMVRQLAGHPAPRASSIEPRVPRWLDELIATAIEAEPARRYASAGPMIAAYREGLHQAEVQTITTKSDAHVIARTPDTRHASPSGSIEVRRSSKPLVFFVPLLSVLLLGGAALAVFGRRGSSSHEGAGRSASSTTRGASGDGLDGGADETGTIAVTSNTVSPNDNARAANSDVSGRSTVAPTTTILKSGQPQEGRQRCQCMSKDTALCERRQSAECGCTSPIGHTHLCTVEDPKDSTKCLKNFVMATPGAPCRGRRGAALGKLYGDPQDGTFAICSFCRMPIAQRRTYLGANGEACRGYTDEGHFVDGTLNCAP